MGLAATALENGGLPVWLGDGSPRNLALLISQEADVDALDSTTKLVFFNFGIKVLAAPFGSCGLIWEALS